MRYICIVIAMLMAGVSSAYAKEIKATNVSGKECKHGLVKQPNSPFAIMVFCEDALGSYMGLVCYDAGKCDRENMAWKLADRMWQQAYWASDVSSLVWSENHRFLYVATNPIYGSGGVFQLDLAQRKARQLLPDSKVSVSTPGPGYILTSLSDNGLSLAYQFAESAENKKPLVLKLNKP